MFTSIRTAIDSFSKVPYSVVNLDVNSYEIERDAGTVAGMRNFEDELAEIVTTKLHRKLGAYECICGDGTENGYIVGYDNGVAVVKYHE